METTQLDRPQDKTGKSPKQTGGVQTFNQPLIDCINHLVNAMRSDFGHKFKSQFKDPDELTQYKKRLYRKLDSKHLDDIVEAYESFLEAKPEWPPTVPEMIVGVYNIEKAIKKREQNRVEAERVAALPAPTHDCNPIEMLAEAKAKNESETKAEMVLQHEALLKLHSGNINKRFADDYHLCSVSNCSKAGTVTASVRGGENWYCMNHFRVFS